MVALSFDGRSRASFQTIACLVGFFASLVSAVPGPYKQGGGHGFPSQRRQNGTLEQCLSAAGIETSLPSSATWATDSQAWNARVSPVPAAVIFPTTEEEVSAALACASTTNTKVTTLGGNRSFSSMGFGRNDGALIVNLKNLKIMEFDESTNVFTYGGPVMISDAATFMWEGYQRTLPHGRCPDVGMTGVAAAGFGTLSRASGTVLDNIVGVRVALANGTIVDADESANEDIYWGVRGAASSMGVVLQYKINTLEPPSQVVRNYTIEFSEGYVATQQDNVDALLGTQAWAQSEDNNDLLSIRYFLRKSSDMKGFFYGSAEEFATVSASLLKYLPANMTVTSDEFDFWASEELTTPGLQTHDLTDRRYFYITSVTIPESGPLNNETAWQLYSSTAYQTKAEDVSSMSGFVDIWGGAYTNGVKVDTSAWKHDANLLLVRWDMRTASADAAFAESSLAEMRANFYTFVDAYKAGGGQPGGFTTYRDERWTKEETIEYLYGSNYARLQEIKTAVDPNEMFNTDPQAVLALK